jgi:ribonuclease BN (tRNA processing enzyme)
MRVITLGTGDAFGTAGRFHSAVVVQAGSSTALVDCGPCILPALHRSRITPEDIDFILVTHLHGDHVGGVPMLLLDYQYRSRRKRPLMVIGSALCPARLEALTGLMFAEVTKKRRRFPVVYKTIRPGRPITIRGMRTSTGNRALAIASNTAARFWPSPGTRPGAIPSPRCHREPTCS